MSMRMIIYYFHGCTTCEILAVCLKPAELWYCARCSFSYARPTRDGHVFGTNYWHHQCKQRSQWYLHHKSQGRTSDRQGREEKWKMSSRVFKMFSILIIHSASEKIIRKIPWCYKNFESCLVYQHLVLPSRTANSCTTVSYLFLLSVLDCWCSQQLHS